MTRADESRLELLNWDLDSFGGIVLRKKEYLDGVNAVWSRGTERAHSSPGGYWRRPPGGAALVAVLIKAQRARGGLAREDAIATLYSVALSARPTLNPLEY